MDSQATATKNLRDALLAHHKSFVSAAGGNKYGRGDQLRDALIDTEIAVLEAQDEGEGLARQVASGESRKIRVATNIFYDTWRQFSGSFYDALNEYQEAKIRGQSSTLYKAEKLWDDADTAINEVLDVIDSSEDARKNNEARRAMNQQSEPAKGGDTFVANNHGQTQMTQGNSNDVHQTMNVAWSEQTQTLINEVAHRIHQVSDPEVRADLVAKNDALRDEMNNGAEPTRVRNALLALGTVLGTSAATQMGTELAQQATELAKSIGTALFGG